MARPVTIEELNEVSEDWQVVRPATPTECRNSEAINHRTKAIYWVVTCKHCSAESIRTTNNIRRGFMPCKTCVTPTMVLREEKQLMNQIKKETRRAAGAELVACDGRTFTIKQWAKITGVPAADILARYNNRDKTGAYGYGIIYGDKLPSNLNGWVDQITASIKEVLNPNIMRIAQSLRAIEQLDQTLLNSLAGANFKVQSVDQTISEMLTEGMSIAELATVLSCETFSSLTEKRDALSPYIHHIAFAEDTLTELEIAQLLSVYKWSEHGRSNS